MKCPVCGSEKSFTALSPEFCSTDNYMCMDCGLVFIPRKNDEIHHYYTDDGYFEKSPNLSFRRFFVNARMFYRKGREAMLNLESRLGLDLQGKRLLDVGCGYGEMVGALVHERGALAEGLEASGTAAEDGEKMFGVRIHAGLLENFKTEAPYDVITCHHTLEHIADPYAFMENIRRLLKPEGKLYFELPNILRPSGGFSLEQFLYHEHVQNFSAANLALFFNRCGFGVQAYDDTDFLKFWLTPDGVNAVNVLEIRPESILAFLRDYKKNYGFGSKLKVYFEKALYLMALLCCKLLPPKRFAARKA